jgi:hypothetical protein
MHRNISLRRLTIDFWQVLRCQRPVVARFGRPYRCSRRRIEIDITYRCNLRCTNCNRSCGQAPAAVDMPVSRVAQFLRDSQTAGIRWERIRLLGGEPTLHPDLAAILRLLARYRARHNPRLRLVIGTNGRGRRVRRIVSRLPSFMTVKNTYKTERARLFRPFNLAPADLRRYRYADFSSGCRILEDCGLGLTPQGYYPCAIAGGIDRIFGFRLGRKRLPAPEDDMRDLLERFCPLCGHFGFAWPTKRPRMSVTWRQAYADYHALHGAGCEQVPIDP